MEKIKKTIDSKKKSADGCANPAQVKRYLEYMYVLEFVVFITFFILLQYSEVVKQEVEWERASLEESPEGKAALEEYDQWIANAVQKVFSLYLWLEFV